MNSLKNVLQTRTFLHKKKKGDHNIDKDKQKIVKLMRQHGENIKMYRNFKFDFAMKD